MAKDLEKLAYDWVVGDSKTIDGNSEYYCQTRDIFKARAESMTTKLLKSDIGENVAYIVSAIVGEIGNNSFDHNLGNWPDIMGLFFGYSIDGNAIKVVLADRGRGILKTLKKVKPELKNDEEALQTAFYEKISGRAPENRGNGLKFVRSSVEKNKMHLTFISGQAQIEFNNDVKKKKFDNRIGGCLAILKFGL